MNRQILEILQILFKRKLLVLSTFVLVFAPIAIGTFMRPTLYQASGHLMVTADRAYFRISPGEARQPPQPDTRVVNNEIVNLKSDSFLVKVAERLPASASPEESGGKGAANAQENAVSQPAHSSTNGKVDTGPLLFLLSQGLEAVPVPNSSLIEVTYTGADPHEVATVVNTVLDVYPTHQASLYQDPISLTFYDGQKATLEKDITELETQLHTFQTQEHLVAWQEQRSQILKMIEGTRDRLKGADLDINQGVGKIAAVEKQLTNQPENVVILQDLIDPDIKLLHEKLTTLELERNALLQRYTEKDRQVEDKTSEIEALQTRLAGGASKKIVVGERKGLNEVRQSLLRERVEQQVKLGQINAKRDKLVLQLQELTAELESLETKGQNIQRLEEIVASKKELLKSYSKKSEEARLAGELDKEKLVNVKAIGYAQAPLAPMNSGAVLSLILAAIIGIGAGVGGAFALEYIRPVFNSALDVENRLELPVLALIPDLREPEPQ